MTWLLNVVLPTPIWGLNYQKQVSQAWISNCIPQNVVGCNYISLLEIPASGNKVHIYDILYGSWWNIIQQPVPGLWTEPHLITWPNALTTKGHYCAKRLSWNFMVVIDKSSYIIQEKCLVMQRACNEVEYLMALHHNDKKSLYIISLRKCLYHIKRQ